MEPTTRSAAVRQASRRLHKTRRPQYVMNVDAHSIDKPHGHRSYIAAEAPPRLALAIDPHAIRFTLKRR